MRAVIYRVTVNITVLIFCLNLSILLCADHTPLQSTAIGVMKTSRAHVAPALIDLDRKLPIHVKSICLNRYKIRYIVCVYALTDYGVQFVIYNMDTRLYTVADIFEDSERWIYFVQSNRTQTADIVLSAGP